MTKPNYLTKSKTGRCWVNGCKRQHANNVKNILMCSYHRWKKYPERVSGYFWDDFQYHHPRLVKTWREEDPEFDKMISTMERRGRRSYWRGH